MKHTHTRTTTHTQPHTRAHTHTHARTHTHTTTTTTTTILNINNIFLTNYPFQRRDGPVWNPALFLGEASSRGADSDFGEKHLEF